MDAICERAMPDAQGDKLWVSLLCQPKHFFLTEGSMLIVYWVYLLQVKPEWLFLLYLYKIHFKHLYKSFLLGQCVADAWLRLF